VSVVRFRPWAPFKDIENIQPLERPLNSQMAYEFQERVMHKQSHQNTHPTFTYRKGRICISKEKSQVICGVIINGQSLFSR
jgi:hypothetical protein